MKFSWIKNGTLSRVHIYDLLGWQKWIIQKRCLSFCHVNKKCNRTKGGGGNLCRTHFWDFCIRNVCLRCEWIFIPGMQYVEVPSFFPPVNEVCEGYVFTRVCHLVHRGGVCWDTTPRADTPRSRHPPPSEQVPPYAVHAVRYGQQAGGMHPTGMQSCIYFFFGRSKGDEKIQWEVWSGRRAPRW